MSATPIIPTPQETDTRNFAEAMGSVIRSKAFHDFAHASYLFGQAFFMGSVCYSIHRLWAHIDVHKHRLDCHEREIARLDSNQEAILGYIKALVDHTEDGAEAYLRLAEDDPGSTLDEVVDRATEPSGPKPGETDDDEPPYPKADEVVDWRDEEPVSDAAAVEVVPHHEDEEA